MSSKLQITQLRLKNYRQFKNVCFDFVNHETGEPLDKVCFIGANGTGKTTVLALLGELLRGNKTKHAPDNSIVLLKIRDVTGEEFYSLQVTSISEIDSYHLWLAKSVDSDLSWQRLWEYEGLGHGLAGTQLYDYLKRFDKYQVPQEKIDLLKLRDDSSDLAIFASPDGSSLLQESWFNQQSKLPNTTLNDALELMEKLPAFHQFSHSDVAEFWRVLIYQIKKRESDFFEFLKLEEVRKLPVEEAERKFNLENPGILRKLADVWNIILAPAGLEFDVENASIPVQLNENLEAYIHLKSSHEIVHYNKLSTGIRNFIFRLGHIFSLYFNREIERGFLLVDEPELSLFPDLLFNIIESYESIIQNTQFFVATHSPMVAAQFKASERFILEFDENGYVQVRQGVSPEGDDPNDLLINDFTVRSLYGKVGQEQWQRVLELRKVIKKTEDIDLKTELLDEYMTIVNAYNFAPNELS